MNKPVCVLSQPLDFLPFLSLSRLCKSSTGALQPASGAEISTSSQLCARLSAVCCSQELAGNQFKMFHFQTPPHNPWISLFTLAEAGAGAFNHFALAFSVGRARTSPVLLTRLCHCDPQPGAKADPTPSSSSDFLALPPHHPFTNAHTFSCPQLHLESRRHCHPPHASWARSRAPLSGISYPPAHAPPLPHPLLEGNSHCSTVPRAEKKRLMRVS